jgi:hypothetical protein
MRVKRSASKAAFRQNNFAVYDRLSPEGLSRKTASRYAVILSESRFDRATPRRQ